MLATARLVIVAGVLCCGVAYAELGPCNYPGSDWGAESFSTFLDRGASTDAYSPADREMVTKLWAYASKCNPDLEFNGAPDPTLPEDVSNAADADGDPVHSNVEEAIKGLPKNATSPVLSQVMNSPDGVPVPQAFALGITQLVSGGQPGFSAAGSGAFAPTSRNPVASHLGGTLNALVIQPVGGSTGAASLQRPDLAALEVVVGYDSRVTPYDLYSLAADNLRGSEKWVLSGRAAARIFLQSFKQKVELSLSQHPDAGVPQPTDGELKDALEHATRRALQMYRTIIVAYLQKLFDDNNDPVLHGRLNVHVRASPDPTYAPELPDLFSAVLDANLESRYVELAGWGVSGNLRAQAGMSGAPNAALLPKGSATGCTSLDCDWRPSLYLEAYFSAKVAVPAQLGVAGRSSLALAGFVRSVPLRDSQETSGGYSITANVPLQTGLSLVASFSERFFVGRRPVATTGVSLVKDLGN